MTKPVSILIIDTVPVEHQLDPYLPMLDVDAMLVIVR
ncbi:hypothetical protein PD5205_02187 [Xanthomonas fragariae]|nr:Zinc-containing alcohol dehydrogenase superfamily protein [Xanthomonas fragariae LMG 25863]SMR03489.1 hypothetical protein PD5205_02187 [Xanthomonas fragariae]